MSERTVDGDCALSSVSEVRRARSKGYLLGLAISASIWTVLCIATTITVTSPLVPRLPDVALSQQFQESRAHGGAMRVPLFEARFE